MRPGYLPVGHQLSTIKESSVALLRAPYGEIKVRLVLEWFFTIVLWWFGICMAAVAIGLAYRKWRSRTPELAVAFNAEIAGRSVLWPTRRSLRPALPHYGQDLKNQLWLTEEGQPTDLFSRFGWYHHKRSRYAGSMSHNSRSLASTFAWIRSCTSISTLNGLRVSSVD